MTTITINAITHKQACLHGASQADASAYDAACEAVFAKIKAAAFAAGFLFEVDSNGQSGASYRVTDEAGQGDLQAAHDFMQSPAADFWALY